MKKSFVILLLALLQCACGTQQVNYQPANSLLSFSDIADEITVEFETIDGDELTDRTVAMSTADSP